MTVLNDRASAIGSILLDRMNEWTSGDKVAELSGETPYAVRWYVHQLREAGYVVEAVKHVDRDAFTNGARGYKLTDIRDEPYRPADDVKPEPVEVPTTLAEGVAVEHAEFGRGRVTFAKDGAPKVVVTFKRKRVERVERGALTILGLGN